MNASIAVLKFAIAALRAGAGQFTPDQRRNEIRYLTGRLDSIQK